MSRFAGTALVVGLIAALTVLGVAPTFSSTDSSSKTAQEVVMFRCTTDASSFEVTAYKGSAATPTKRSNSCPEVLAQLLRNGYEIVDIGHSRVDSNFVVYTLQR